MKLNKTLKIILSILICELAGIIGSIFTISAIPTWYANITKPSFSPPNWIFGPVWTLLYLFMGISLYLVWKKHSDILENVGMLKIWKWGIVMFFVQLVLNTVWSPIFFGLRNPGWAFVELIFLWLSIVATIFLFSKISKSAMWLLIPYILWVTFAGYLNYSIWQISKAKVPASQVPASWLEYKDATSSVNFRYPADFGTTFLHPQEGYWPPKIQILNQPFSCTEGGSEIMLNGQTTKEALNGKDYCVTKESEGAAGSVYESYIYAFPFKGQTATLSFTVRFVQCYNYDEPSTTKCLNERSAFDVDKIAGQIAETVSKI